MYHVGNMIRKFAMTISIEKTEDILLTEVEMTGHNITLQTLMLQRISPYIVNASVKV